MARRRRKVKKTEFDLTPMIDVTFQLLIFFIITMKIKQKERRESADLPQDEGPAPSQDMEPKDFIVVRLFWIDGQMVYEVNVKHGNDMGKSPKAVHAGTLETLINDRNDPRHVEYQRIFDGVLNRINELVARYSKAEKFEIAMSLDSTKSSGDQIDNTAPWGFVTLVVDVLTQFNKTRREQGQEPFSVTFKNTEPDGAPRLG